MDKNLRPRRNGIPERTNGPITDTDATITSIQPGKTDTALTPGQQARQRIEAAHSNARAEGTPALQDAFMDERNDVMSVINELEDQLDRHQEIRETIERELTGTTEKLQVANTRVQELEWQVVTLQTRIDALEQSRQQVATLEEELADANARAHRTKDQLAIAEKERAQLKNDIKAVNKQLDELFGIRKERDSLRSDYKTLSVKVEELERNQREMFEERGQLQAELQEARATIEQITTERNQLQMNLRSGDDRIRELMQIQDGLTDKIDGLRGEKKNLQVQMTHIERENARLVEQRQFYECEVTSLRNQARTAEAALASVKKAFAEVRVALTDTKIRARRRTVDTWPRIGSTVAPQSVIATGTMTDVIAGADAAIVPTATETTHDITNNEEVGIGGPID